MLNSKIRNQIDTVWDTFWTGYLFITNPKLDLSFSAMSQGYVAITS